MSLFGLARDAQFSEMAQRGKNKTAKPGDSLRAECLNNFLSNLEQFKYCCERESVVYLGGNHPFEFLEIRSINLQIIRFKEVEFLEGFRQFAPFPKNQMTRFQRWNYDKGMYICTSPINRNSENYFVPAAIFCKNGFSLLRFKKSSNDDKLLKACKLAIEDNVFNHEFEFVLHGAHKGQMLFRSDY